MLVVVWTILYTDSIFVEISSLVYLFPPFMNPNILFNPLMEFRNSLEETDPSLLSSPMSF
jgi:hypothetical protein